MNEPVQSTEKIEMIEEVKVMREAESMQDIHAYQPALDVGDPHSKLEEMSPNSVIPRDLVERLEFLDSDEVIVDHIDFQSAGIMVPDESEFDLEESVSCMSIEEPLTQTCPVCVQPIVNFL